MSSKPKDAVPRIEIQGPHYVRIACGTFERLLQAFAALDPQAFSATTPLQRNNSDAKLRRRNRAGCSPLADPPRNQEHCLQTRANVLPN